MIKVNCGDELKSCPFCGTQPELRASDKLERVKGYEFCVLWTVKCPKCQTQKSRVSVYEFDFRESIDIKHDGLTKVIDEWNGRATDGTEQ